MQPIGNLTEQIKAWAKRCGERAEDPEFQRRAAELAAQDKEAEKRSREAERQNALLSAGIPMPWWEILREPKETDSLGIVRRFLDAPPACVFLALVGPKGRGKSVAACWAVARRGGLYVESAQNLVTAGTFSPVWTEMETAPLLVVDELGTEYRNDAFEASLYALLNARYARQRKTILVTNLDAVQFKARYGAAGMDRLIERIVKGGMFETVPGESIRPHWSDEEDD